VSGELTAPPSHSLEVGSGVPLPAPCSPLRCGGLCGALRSLLPAPRSGAGQKGAAALFCVHFLPQTGQSAMAAAESVVRKML
jgi:hypothetical protein